MAPFLIIGPAAVRMLTLRMTVVREGKGAYVLGNGSAFGVDADPRPKSACVESRAGVAEVVVWDGADAQAAAPTRRRQRKARMVKGFPPKKDFGWG
jgi:hypothetical protein